jgi:hypothetical protein
VAVASLASATVLVFAVVARLLYILFAGPWLRRERSRAQVGCYDLMLASPLIRDSVALRGCVDRGWDTVSTEEPHPMTAVQLPGRNIIDAMERKSTESRDCHRISPLNSGWLAARCRDVGLSGEQLSCFGTEDMARGSAPGQWLKAQVPGTVLSSLVAEGVFPDPFIGTNLQVRSCRLQF